jgi:glycosyltransferase involved in cell wall biosynthesis
MRILFLIRSLELGGAERQLVLLANGLAARGHRVGVAVFYGGGALEPHLDGPELFHLGKQGRWDVIPFWRSLRRCLKAFRPDILHGYLGTANNLTVLAKGTVPAMKAVWGIRSTDVDFSAYGRLARLDSRVQSLLSPLADLVIVNSHKGLADAEARGVRGRRCLVIPNGIDTGSFAPDRALGASLREAWGADGKTCLVGIVGRLDPMKGHDLFLEAARLVAATDPCVRFVCVGHGPLAGELTGLTRDLGLSDAVAWAGPQADMPAVYNALDICCLASSFGEGFPNVLGEAMSCGVPCVATDVGDAAVIVGNAGYVVPGNDARVLAEALTRMVKAVRAGTAPATRERMVREYSLDRMILATEQALAEVLA